MSIPQGKVSVEDYERYQQISDDRLEFLNGTIRAMAGTTLEHEKIFINLICLLDEKLKELNYTLVTGQIQVKIEEIENTFLHPDIHIYYGKGKEIKKDKKYSEIDILINPTLIIEVLSNTTRNYDKGDKFECYRKVKSLKSYIMIESDTKEKEPTVYVRTIEDEKNFTEKVLGIDEILDILGCKVDVKDIYGI